ncbi:PD-(D/E)XK nuclease family protein [Dyadobacter frigoris]|uniref:Nuclease n=1 Tax=Dyadobacter frigoris TaxID=2576211 RepID=A0A4U6D4T8_9BACT|nr:PD-(D/E)XK nuclease family protein [Dyadobacter frigoris]TKT91415.1 nuclease [Dyadobacter frigoris]GLU52033.1 hypothetical protein Dfri01_14940 [Dyadobacter frigoris]
MIPNIFDIATKELHQDAFIVWLLKWADPENKKYDPLLCACGQDFVKQLIAKQSQDSISSIEKVKAGRQKDNIDIWAEVSTTENSYFIIIEDKIFSKQHGKQLVKYEEHGELHALETKFKSIYIYLKTGSESIIEMNSGLSNFKSFIRKDFINIFKRHENISNNIFLDFKSRLIRLDDGYKAFNSSIIYSWTEDYWIGFYEFLETQFSDLNWSFVNRRDGSGFWNAYFIPAINDRWNGHSVYLQIEQGRLCFKINTDDSEKDRTKLKFLRNALGKIIFDKAEILKINEIQKPKSLGIGNAMTVAVIESETWLGPSDSIIDKEAVINRLKRYRAFLGDVLRSN